MEHSRQQQLQQQPQKQSDPCAVDIHDDGGDGMPRLADTKHSAGSTASERDSLTAKLAALARLDPPLDPALDLDIVVRRVIEGSCAGMTPEQGDTLLAETAVALSSSHLDYEKLAARVAVTALHASTPPRFSDAVALLAANVERRTDRPVPLVSDELVAFVAEHKEVLDAAIHHSRDFGYSYFGLATMRRSYLTKVRDVVVERPQYMLMRVALGHYGFADVDNALAHVLATYEAMSQQLFTSATPTLFNAGTPRPQNSSCFLLDMKADSIEGIYDTLKQCALISKAAGGIGFAAHKVRAAGAYVAGTNGQSNGLVPMLRVFNDTARYVDQCFSGDTLVLTAERGPVPIGLLYREAAIDIATGPASDGSDHAPETSVVPTTGVRVLSDDGRWCPLRSVVRHAPSTRPTYLIGAGSTFVPHWATPPVDALRFGHGVRVTPQHQVQVLCDLLDDGRPVVIANDPIDAQDTANAEESDDDHTATNAEGSLAKPTTTLEAVTKMNKAATGKTQKESNEDGEDASGKNNKDDDSENSRDGETDTDTAQKEAKRRSADALGLRLVSLCERINRGHVAPRMVDAEQLVPGAVLCVPIPPEPTESPWVRTKPSDWRMAGILHAAIVHGAVQIGARVDTRTATFINTYLAIADPDCASASRPKNGICRWRIAHPGFTMARSLAAREVLASAPTLAIEAFVRGVCEGLDGSGASPFLVDTLRWLSLRLTRRAASFSPNAEAIAAGKAAILSCRTTPSPLSTAPTTDGTPRTAVSPWSIVHGDIVHVPIESIDMIVQDTNDVDNGDPTNVDGDGNNNDANATKPVGTSGAEGDDGALYDLEVDDPNHTYSVLGFGACHNGGGKRKGAFACYLEPWHADLINWLDLKKNHGKEENRARDLFYGLWTCDLFMRRMVTGRDWSLFCPSEAPGLHECYGAAFDALYERYEREGRARTVVPARQIWSAIVAAHIETGTPYMVYKDAVNLTSNQQNLGTTTEANLCTEIVQFSSPTESAVCNLSSVALPKFVIPDPRGEDRSGPLDLRYDDAGVALGMVFDHGALHEIVQAMARNLNRVIDINHYPVPEARHSNLRHRPMGVGVQGLADVFALMDLPWESAGARRLNRAIFETVYHAAATASAQLAAQDGPYPSYYEGTYIDGQGNEVRGSPASRGLLHPDLWAAAVNDQRRWAGCDHEEGDPPEKGIPLPAELRRPFDPKAHESGRWDWDALRASVRQHGLRNSLLVALMPTATTSQILGNTEAFEVITSNIYTRRVLSGDFTVVNRHLVKRMMARGLWTPDFRDRLIAAQGSVQGFDDEEVPPDLKALFKTVWEVPNRVTIDMAADRAPYVDQSQSLNLYLADPTAESITSMHAYAWRRGLKTGMYYLRTRPAANAIQFTVDQATASAAAVVATDAVVGDATLAETAPTESPKVDIVRETPRSLRKAAAVVAQTDGDACYPGCESCSG
ncbi:Ribonucleoside--diphosphate reductase incomplete domain containing protein [Pandoravirus celtis]|uniref:Ribonucleoside-diphosphate reductase n=1 Tax=Pandoravirus celtis TaxID=2568002 RepID=A0A4D6EIH9_9VIRU|nr:Ribonucleoside--diphosphate reductase incomplete domain containing protein [Pandoravirus celtis]